MKPFLMHLLKVLVFGDCIFVGLDNISMMLELPLLLLPFSFSDILK